MMADGMDRPDILRAVLIDEAESRGGAHLGLDRLVAYRDGILEGEEQESVRDHLVSCRRCADQLLEAELLTQPDAAPPNGVVDLEIESAWRRFQALAGTAAAPVPLFGARRRVMALAASLAVTALALGLWVARLQETNAVLRLQTAELTAPIVNMPVFHFEAETYRAVGDRTDVELPVSTSHSLLIFSVADLGTADEYQVRFLDQAGRERQSFDGLLLSAGGSLRLGIPRGALPEGIYQIQVRARQGAVWRLVGEYRCRIRRAEEPTIGSVAQTEPPR